MPARGSAYGYAEETIVPSAARTANGDSGALSGYGTVSEMRLQLDVTAASGSAPKLQVFVEDTIDGTRWVTRGQFADITVAGSYGLRFEDEHIPDRIRLRWVITGTSPSFTFSVIAATWARPS